ncbi:hypothetical protein DFH11DRAFT_1639350, partial [Phellopilus nigrolimitatus]
MKAFLRIRSWLLDLTSLELHVLTNRGQNQHVKDLLDLLFGTTDSYHKSESDWEHDIFSHSTMSASCRFALSSSSSRWNL